MRLQPLKNDGFALLVVILVMLLTSFLASELIMKVRTELKITANNRQRLAGRLLAEGGVNLAIFRLSGNPDLDYEEILDGPGFLLGRTYETVLPAGKIEYYAVNDSGKINLNAAPTGLLKKFLEYHGLEEEEVAVVVDSLMDWRDNDDLYRLDGAEKSYYQGLDRPYIPRNGPIEDPAEFFLVRGTELLRGKIDPYEVFTVNNSGTKINYNSLSPDMLAFLVGGDEAKIELYREEHELALGKLGAAKIQEIVGPERYVEMKIYLAGAQGNNRSYSITAHGYAGDFGPEKDLADEGEGSPVRREPGTRVMVQVEVNSKGFQYMSWKEQHG